MYKLSTFYLNCSYGPSKPTLEEKTAREEAEEEAELVRLSEGWSRARAVQIERCWSKISVVTCIPYLKWKNLENVHNII